MPGRQRGTTHPGGGGGKPGKLRRRFVNPQVRPGARGGSGDRRTGRGRAASLAHSGQAVALHGGVFHPTVFRPRRPPLHPRCRAPAGPPGPFERWRRDRCFAGAIAGPWLRRRAGARLRRRPSPARPRQNAARLAQISPPGSVLALNCCNREGCAAAPGAVSVAGKARTQETAMSGTHTTGDGTITVTLDGTNRQTRLPLMPGTLGPPVFDIRKLYADLGVFTFDPGYGGTAACDSKITFIDGDEGVLLYRGYPIEQLAEHSTFLE